ncbi:Isoprenoid synthase domain containing protein [Amanita muscaria]
MACHHTLTRHLFKTRPSCLRRRLSSVSTQASRPDPFTLVSSNLSNLRASLLTLLRSGHPALTEITEYYFLHPSKQIRPLLVLLLSQATNGLGSQWERKLKESRTEEEGCLDAPLTRPDVLNDWNPNFPTYTREFKNSFELDAIKWEKKTRSSSTQQEATTTSNTPKLPLILPTQTRLAQILEMIHTASLLHDDVIDASPLRRGNPSAPFAFGKKLSVLGGNFILGRASGALARLGDVEVTELIASILANLVDGEILQVKKGGRMRREDAWNSYLQKTYLKTASLMAKGARAAVVLGGCKEGDIVREIAYAYGRNLGIAFQLVDDVMDYEFASSDMGKPGGADLQLGLATGPALYAWEEHPEMGELIQRKFEKEGDVERARDFIRRSSGVQRTRVLAHEYADKAKEVIQSLPDSEAKVALEVLTERVVGRKS